MGNKEHEAVSKKLQQANKDLAFYIEEKEKREAELIIANKELVFQNQEKENRASELVLANIELAFQNEEKENRALELVVANQELNQLNELLQRNLKEISDYKYALDEATIIAVTDKKGGIKRANNNFCKISKYSEEELIGQDHRIINSGYHPKEFIRDLWVTIGSGKIWKGEVKNKAKDGTFYWVDTTIVPFLNEEGKPYQYLAIRADITDRKEAEEYLIQRTAQLGAANKELAFQNEEKEKRASELVLANKELAFQNEEKEKRAAELILANKELAFQNDEKENRAAELILANKELTFQNEEKENRAAELILANKELAFQNEEKENRASELVVANKELAFQNEEKENRAAELVVANKELVFQNEERENRAAELILANKELVFQNEEKENRAAELVLANKELAFQNEEKKNRASELITANKEHAELVVANKELGFQNQEKEKRETELVEVNNELINLTKALSESETLFRNMIETISQMAWILKVDAEATFFNQQWYDYTGLDYKQTKAHGWYTIIHPDDLQQALEKFRLIQNGSSAAGASEVRYRRADGKYRWHLVSMLPVKNEHGEVQLWIVSATDIQHLKELQQQKDDFISIASHELKTPMTALTASLQLLNRMKDNPSHKMFPSLVERSNKSLDKLNILVKDLLNVSRFSEGQLHVKKTQFTISEMIDDCCPHVRAEGIYSIKTEGDMDLQVCADAERIGQVLINFVNNAIKYAPDSKEVQINIVKIDNMAKVSVIDKGPGISPDKIPHLFDRYFRVDNSGSQYSGLGLGLYISAEIIKKHGGQIGADSEVGKGSTFWFTLPTMQPAEVAH